MKASKLKRKQTVIHDNRMILVGKVEEIGAGRFASVAVTTFHLEDGRAVLDEKPSVFFMANDDVIVMGLPA